MPVVLSFSVNGSEQNIRLGSDKDLGQLMLLTTREGAPASSCSRAAVFLGLFYSLPLVSGDTSKEALFVDESFKICQQS